MVSFTDTANMDIFNLLSQNYLTNKAAKPLSQVETTMVGIQQNFSKILDSLLLSSSSNNNTSNDNSENQSFFGLDFLNTSQNDLTNFINANNTSTSSILGPSVTSPEILTTLSSQLALFEKLNNSSSLIGKKVLINNGSTKEEVVIEKVVLDVGSVLIVAKDKKIQLKDLVEVLG